MFYEVAGKNVDLSGEVSTEDMLKDIIETDQRSQAKIEMVQGTNYYSTVNDILNRDFREFYVDGNKYIDYNKSNDCIVNNLHKKLIDQKQGYICGKALTIKCKDEQLLAKVNELLGDDFNDILNDWVKNASNKGTEELQPFLDEDGDFKYCLIPSEQVIYITDTTYQKNVEQAIRYYEMEFVEDGEIKKRKRVEVWDKEKVTRYQEVDDDFGNTYYQFIYPNTWGVVINPQYHWYAYNTNYTDKSQLSTFNDVDKVGVDLQSWGKVPLIQLKNNSESRSDLIPIKRYIDALDIVSSGFINDLKDLQLAIWVLRGYEGESLGDFMLNLQKFKAIKLSIDDGASAEPKTMDIPKEARVALMEWLEGKIYEVGQGVDEQRISGGSITNVVIKAMYEGLNIKANNMIIKLKSALQDFMYFAVEFINDRDNTSYNYKDINFVFNLSMLSNEKDKAETVKTAIEGILMLKGTMSDETIMKLLIKNADLGIEIDVAKEIEIVAAEQKKQLADLGNDMGFGDE